MKIVCEQCGNEFEGKTKRARFCSNKCRLRSHRNVPEKRVCICGNEFETNGKQLYCSDECAELARADDQRHYAISRHDTLDYNTDSDEEDLID